MYRCVLPAVLTKRGRVADDQAKIPSNVEVRAGIDVAPVPEVVRWEEENARVRRVKGDGEEIGGETLSQRMMPMVSEDDQEA